MSPMSASALDAHVREIVQWHFDPETGTPFWLDVASKLDWDPRKEIHTYRDLDRFGFFQDEWLRGGPVRRWVPKGVSHQLRLKALLEAYPDAIFVWIHRDPLQAAVSRVELTAQILEGIAGPLDREAFAQATVASCRSNFRHTAQDPTADDPRIQHLHYKTFTRDPVAAIRDIYETAGLTVTAAFEAAMRHWLAANPPDRYGRFTYPQELPGVDMAELDRSFEPYRERFGVPREQPKG